jgi:hypothetical protein
MDNVFIERLWRSSMRTSTSRAVPAAERFCAIAAWMEFSIIAAFTRRSDGGLRDELAKAKAVDMMDSAIALITQPKQ